MSQAGFSRRMLLGSAVALASCQSRAQIANASSVHIAPLRRIAPFPVGAAVNTGGLHDPSYTDVLLSQFDQITADWEMKMEVILKPDGGFDFAKADEIAAFAVQRRLRLHGHNLIWYVYSPQPFLRLEDDRAAFRNAYRNYVLAVAGRYRDQAVGWDVVNEPVAEDGEGYRDCLWRRVMGMDYVATAFHNAREAAPDAVLFLNDYNLESNPRKRVSFMRLAHELLDQGAPLGGLGAQTHLDVDWPAGQVAAAIRDLASLGIPIHVSELDVSTRGRGLDLSDLPTRLNKQARLVGETVEAFAALPERQRYAVTAWGVRDCDSWLRRAPNAGDGSDRPLLFDDQGRPKPAALAFAGALS